MLGLLLVRSHQVVPADELITEVWGDDPPRRARAALHVSISHLRRFLARPDRAGNPIVTQAGGYLLDLSRDEQDAHGFVRLAELGRHRELVPSLYSLTVEHPLREVFYRQLMLALYRSDRKADALMVYRAARRTLNAELGLEPSRSVQDLQRTILMADAPAR